MSGVLSLFYAHLLGFLGARSLPMIIIKMSVTLSQQPPISFRCCPQRISSRWRFRLQRPSIRCEHQRGIVSIKKKTLRPAGSRSRIIYSLRENKDARHQQSLVFFLWMFNGTPKRLSSTDFFFPIVSSYRIAQQKSFLLIYIFTSFSLSR